MEYASKKFELVQTENKEKKEKTIMGSVFHRFDTWKGRIEKFLDGKELTPKDVDLDDDAQESYAKVAIATSNVVGKGPGNSDQCDFISQAFSDFIYAIIISMTALRSAAVDRFSDIIRGIIPALAHKIYLKALGSAPFSVCSELRICAVDSINAPFAISDG